MSTDENPKSALDIAMERLRQKDTDSGVVERPVTTEQKEAIAEARSLHASRVAELEILHRAKAAAIIDPAELVKAEDEYRRELQRLRDDLDRKIRKVRDAGD